tara:strand:- start:604 stop:804 length:201 start_codon:yes stop_codon:yes gene_type:complete
MSRIEVNIHSKKKTNDIFVRLIQDLTMDNWREIRTKNYWAEKDKLMNDNEKQKFVIEKILIWKRKQ